MVVAFQPNVLRFVHELHRSERVDGIEAFLRTRRSLASSRSVCRWHRELGDALTYYPSVAYEALGLVHVHLFIEDPRSRWELLPYAVRASWLVCGPAGARVLYLHCLVPREHTDALAQVFKEVCAPHGDRITSVTTSDGWQFLDQEQPRQLCRVAPPIAWNAVEHYPLLIPVICESIEVRRSMPELWSAISERLGDRVWEYLPRGVRRLPHNGKQYVAHALHLVNETLLFRQHVIRYAAYDTITTEIVLRVRAGPEELARLCSRDAPVIEMFPSPTESLVRVHGTPACLAHLFTSCATLDITAWWFVDRIAASRSPLAVRFAYEFLFDPATTEWRFPRDEIKRRLTR
jgi:hypothetical protein